MNHTLKGFALLFLTLLFAGFNVQAQWAKTTGPQGMIVNAFFQSGNKLFAGTTSQGVFKSTDHGVTWSTANTGIENSTVFSLISDGTFLYAGTNTGVFRSSNNGKTWTPANTGIENNFVKCMALANGFLFAGTTSFGLFKSNDHGNTWTDASGGGISATSIHAICFSAPNLVVVGDNEVFFSNDNGNSWFVPQNGPFLFSPEQAFIVHSDSILLASGSQVFQSFDAGQSWGTGFTVNSDISISGLVETNNVIFAGSSVGMFQSKNFGQTWKQTVATGLRFGNRANNAFFKSGSNYLLGFDEIGVAYSSDKGKTWTYTLAGFTPAGSIDNALFVSGSTIYSGTHSDGLYQTLDDGATWTKIGTTNDSLSNAIVFSVLKTGNVILAGTGGFGLFRSTDNGTTFTRIRNGLPQEAGTGILIVKALSQCSTNILAATELGLFFSSDNGLTWHNTNISGSTFNVVGVASNDSVACAVVGALTGPNKIFRSVNKGVSWNTVFSTSSDDFTTIASDGKNHFYVGLFGSGLVSSNNGTSWNSFGTGIPAGQGAFAIGVKGNNVWVGNGTGVYFSNDNATSFTAASTGLEPEPNNSVQGFAIGATSIFAGLNQNAVWKRPLSDFGITTRLTSEIKNDLNISLAPNPVTSQSVLSYHVDIPSSVVITIYDATGRNMKTIMNGSLAAGDYTTNIGNDLEAGNYFVTVLIGGKYSTVKFIVTK